MESIRNVSSGYASSGESDVQSGPATTNRTASTSAAMLPIGTRCRPAPAQSTPSPLGFFLSLSTPRLVDGRPQQVGFLARGLESIITFPGFFHPVVFDEGTPLTVAGAARALNPSSLLIPVRGTCRARERCHKGLPLVNGRWTPFG
jgi:hypothetical protein